MSTTQIKEENTAFVPLIHDIMKSMERDNQEVQQELSRLKSRIQELRETVAVMPGIDLSPEEQHRRLQHLREQVHIKNQLLQKYKTLCIFDNSK
ncbi:mediator of RNA polymerase II transcription subunit 9 [Petromyzon marinus]|uniref:Mediator of RNA polymerase II transcription subunit 9 n=1 Tax=Petromyzon marinus TaxID=7757 RepID=S4RZL4_PETMA|nr:mediator of RNA polymerase II transcription subunit 9 [Petromyzon marinus]